MSDRDVKGPLQRILVGDCRKILQTIEPESHHACVTDPPYELGFMGKTWDKSGVSFDPETWRAVYRVLKPGAHLLAFGGTRTVHRIAVAIEDAGFEIRDQMLYWGYGSGFPKSHNVNKAAAKKGLCCTCEDNTAQYSHEDVSRENVRRVWSGVDAKGSLPSEPQPDVQSRMHGETDWAEEQREVVASQSTDNSSLLGMRGAGVLSSEPSRQNQNTSVLVSVQRETSGDGVEATCCEHEGPKAHEPEIWGRQPGVEGRNYLLQQARELQSDQVREMSGGVSADGSQRRLCDGASAVDGEAVRVSLDQDRSGSSSQSQSPDESRRQFGIVAGQRESQSGGVWPDCPRCGLPILPQGLGSALKPAYEPIIMARKPLAGTLVDNVLRYGTGAMNIDACRIDAVGRPQLECLGDIPSLGIYGDGLHGSKATGVTDLGRWPANVILDEESATSLDGQTGTLTSGIPTAVRIGINASAAFGAETRKPGTPLTGYGDSGGASRFFYTSKASTAERNRGLVGMPERAPHPDEPNGRAWDIPGSHSTARANHHPTVKPIAVMDWLIKLVTPPGGIVLDPFVGSGTSGIACSRLGFVSTLIELSTQNAVIARRRISGDAPLFANVSFEITETAEE